MRWILAQRNNDDYLEMIRIRTVPEVELSVQNLETFAGPITRELNII